LINQITLFAYQKDKYFLVENEEVEKNMW